MSFGIKGALALVSALFVIFPNRGFAIPGDQNWDGRFLPPGIQGEVYAVAARDGNIYVGGNFTRAGSVAAQHIARWDGTNWLALGEGISGTPYALAFLGTNLYVGGLFDQAGNAPANNIAMWDGSEWHDLNGGAESGPEYLDPPRVHCLYTNGGNLYVGGNFQAMGGITVNSIAKWDGTNWSAIGNGINIVGTNYWGEEPSVETQPGLVYAMTFHNGNLCVGGVFNHAGSISATNVAQWEGTNWNNLGDGLNGGYEIIFMGDWYSGTVYALESYQGNLYAGGDFTHSGDLIINALAKWNGSSWQEAGAEISGAVDCLLSHNGELFVGGYFNSVAGKNIGYLAKWDGMEWSGLGTGIKGGVSALCVNGNNIVAGGEFGVAGGKLAAYVAQWNGSEWSSLDGKTGNAIVGTVTSIAAANGRFYAGGWFQSAGTNEASFLASWDGTNWMTLDKEFAENFVNYAYTVVAVGNKVYVSGEFSIPERGITNLAVWDGTNWSGFGVDSDTGIYRIATMGQNVFVSGNFSSIGGVPANGLAVWNGTNWSDITTNLTSFQASFNTLLVKDNMLYIDGRRSGSNYSTLAKWDGVNWSFIEGPATINGAPLYIGAMAFYHNEIVITASYSSSDRNDFYMMRQDGTNWSQIPTPFVSDFTGLVANDNYLYGYGFIANSNGDVSVDVYKWDGANWFPLASGLDKPSGSLYGPTIAVDGNDVAVAGHFTEAGGKASYHFGIWHEPAAPLLSQPRKRNDGSFAFDVLGSDGQKVEVQFSDDLLQWNFLQTNALNSIPLEIIDPSSDGASKRFYRLKQIP